LSAAKNVSRDPSLNQTPKREHKPVIENDSKITRPIAIPLKQFNSNFNYNPDSYESDATRAKPKYNSAREAWKSI
jgi:hypothetical protein